MESQDIAMKLIEYSLSIFAVIHDAVICFDHNIQQVVHVRNVGAQDTKLQCVVHGLELIKLGGIEFPKGILGFPNQRKYGSTSAGVWPPLRTNPVAAHVLP